ncbi:signal peptidase II [Herbaspirillum sp. SJZ107]|uniref:signal peptidase II n=1 Tax=Herbaspirillum sp. SJZ107 TaxID=2572881 RepID=UPI00210385F7|nr:signal peptidase II [Herbaspirillum sp. SJZ107]
MLKRTCLMLMVLLSCVGCDQATKQLVRIHVPESVSYSLWGDIIRLQHTQNHGAFLSLGATFSESTRFAMFVVAAAVALAAMVIYLVRKPGVTAFDIVAVSLVVGGGAGNLIDRIIFRGGVTDFLNLGIGGLRTGIFNIADVAIMIGVGMLFYRSLRTAGRSRA